MRVRPAEPDDLDTICELRLRFLAEERGPEGIDAAFAEVTRSFLERHVRADTIRSWLAETSDAKGDATAIGGVSMLLLDMAPRPGDPRSTDGYLIHMYVEPEQRRRGVGRQLLDAATAAAPELGVRRLLLFSTAAGRPLYESAGFAPDDDWLDLRFGF